MSEKINTLDIERGIVRKYDSRVFERVFRKLKYKGEPRFRIVPDDYQISDEDISISNQSKVQPAAERKKKADAELAEEQDTFKEIDGERPSDRAVRFHNWKLSNQK